MQVSIHAPAWGATGDDGGQSGAASVSIHAPAWGATPAKLRNGEFRTCFNPRARVGRDAQDDDDGEAAMAVSIHAPAWGATMQVV